MAEGGDQDKDSKTEDPTQKKLDDALKKGQVANSKEVTSFLLFLLLTVTAMFILPSSIHFIGIKLRHLIENAGTIPVDAVNLGDLMTYYMKRMFLYTSPVLAIVILAAFFSNFAQMGTLIFTGEQLKPNLNKLSMLKGYKRIVSVKSFVEFLKGVFKIALVGTFVMLVILADVKELSQYQELSIAGILDQMQTMIYHILMLVTMIMAAIAGVDFAFQKYDHFQNMKMTKQEVKDEYKQTEGNPEVKQKMRQLRHQQSQARIAQSVPEATVVITNPEHYAVALKYVVNEMAAPVCVAKGLDLIAQRIKEIADKNDVPIVESPPLARALYKETNIDDLIPTEHYKAVAEIISFVMKREDERKQRKMQAM